MNAVHRPLRTLPWLCAAALTLGCASSQADKGGLKKDSVAWLVQHERYEEAVNLAAKLSAEKPEDAGRADEHRLASAALLMARGRDEFFAGRYNEALELFRYAADIAPESPATQDWIYASQESLADRAFIAGLEAHNDDDFEKAMAFYEEALSYEPDHVLARATLARALLQQNYRRGMGLDYYDDGILALDRYFLHQANSLFAYVLKYEPDHERAELRAEQAQDQLASERARVALDLEESGQFAAARNEFRLALILDPDLELAKLGFERMRREEQVSEKLREADRLRLQQRFDQAQALLEGLRGQTERQTEDIEQLLVQVAEARLETLYIAARALESDFRFEEAVGAYTRLLEQTTFYKDAHTRRDTLSAYVSEAAQLYVRFEASADPAEQLALLRQIAEFWPEYRDVRSRLAQMELASTTGN
jgi:tetratricopeptide (TPR) repeat protein